ncbi:winged helix-turn-helix transcriptional regulator [Labrys okinawensis]|uniref:winged helix-turn-helix transcriptional regulator n=1 Tax=Labrys okinawensis TaxID=346911 RepID=UPI0039BD4BD2
MRYDVYTQACPSRLVLDRVADKWAVLILGRIDDEPVRFNQLRREIQGISQKVLSQTLKKLERDGLIRREVFATVPVTVEYSITDLGNTLADTIRSLARWAEANIEAVTAAQRCYDEAQS